MKKVNVLLFLTFIMLVNCSFSQKIDSTGAPKIDSVKKEFYLKGAFTITNKGISYIPNFSLGKPAMIFDMSLGNGTLSFDPQLRFSIIGEPWAFLFPVRYKITSKKNRFQLNVGLNPLMNFKNVTYTVNGVSTTDLVNRRYLSGEFRPNYFITKVISVGIAYLYFLGVSDGAAKKTHFVSVNANFSDIKLGSKFFARMNAQIYYLNQDGASGWYFNPVLTLLKRKFPFSIQSIMNATINSDIPTTENFMWSLSLIYTFNRTYTPK